MLKSTGQDQIPIIHLLRGLAAFMVAFHHCACWSDGGTGYFTPDSTVVQIGNHGRLGVYIFFVISGFVIPYSLIKNQYKIKNIFRFIFKRGVRIEIPYIASIILGILVAFLYDRLFGWGFDIDFKRFFLNVTYLVPFTSYKWYSIIYWTLGVEFQFYIAIAILIALFAHKNKIIQTISLLAFISINFFQLLKPETAFIYAHTGIFSIGIIACLYYLKKVSLWQVIIVVLFAFIITWRVRNLEIAIFSILTAATIYFINFQSKITYFFGNISYSFYLTHTIIGNNLIYFTLRVWKIPISSPLLLVISLLLAIGFSVLFWWLIERPSKQLAGRIKVGWKK